MVKAKDDFADSIRDNGEKSSDSSVSPKGARGAMQVMPTTASDPGFGVAPATDTSPQELDRVGRDYAHALLGYYNGNRTLAAAAYNAGPGVVDKWISQYGDPRTGGISEADWIGKIPYSETRQYVERVDGGESGQGQSGEPGMVQTAGVTQPPAQPPISPPNVLAMAGASNPLAVGGGQTTPLASPARPQMNPLALAGYNLGGLKFTPIDYDPFKVMPQQPVPGFSMGAANGMALPGVPNMVGVRPPGS